MNNKNSNIQTEMKQLSAKLEFTARITLPDGTVIEKVIEAERGIPSAEEMDFHTLDGFRRSFDMYERAAIEVRDRVCKELTDEYVKKLSKKNERQEEIGHPHKVESELCNTTATFYANAAKSLKSRESIKSLSMEEIYLELTQYKSYRMSSKIANRLLRRHGEDEIKPTTLEYRTITEGKDIAQAYKEKASEILTSYGLDPNTGHIEESPNVPKSILNPEIPESHTWDSCIEKIENYNNRRTDAERISKHELIDKIEISSEQCCYISIDDIGVKHQKEKRNTNIEKDVKYVENTVIHIQSDKQQYTLTTIGMRNAFIMLVAFLLHNRLLEGKRLVFLSDGATNIKDYIQEYFGFREYTLILDWLHLMKKCKEFMSMAVTAKNKDKKSEIVSNLLRILWVGNTDEAIAYLNNLKTANIKNQKILEDMTAYLKRKQPYIQCYALRMMLGLRNSSNTVEKANDLLVAQRQKHNGMSWSKDGSGALATIAAIKRNNELDDWVHLHEVRFRFAA